MRYLILSDIHANIEGLEAVMADARGDYDVVLNCGDVVGYGPDPARAIEFCREHCALTVRGNHDKAVAGLLDMEWFNPMAREAALWSRARLSDEDLAWLAALPQGPVEVDGFSILHGSPEDEDEYIVGAEDARRAAKHVLTGLSFFGHSHVQGGFVAHRTAVRPLNSPVVPVDDTAAYLINPGSVGQPRDGDARAGYLIWDSEERLVDFRRVSYAADVTLDKILRAGLPPALGVRLLRGS